MNIDKVNHTGHLQPVNDKATVKPAESQAASLGSDSVSISQAAMQARESAQAQKTVASASDVRTDRVREVKEKIARGEYDNLSNEVLSHVATRLTTVVKNG
jgi:flagellar biosynthesis anti-sigma factor FlgM